MENNNIGKNIKKYRLLKGWTQEQLAKESGLSKNAIYNYENEKRIPNIKILTQISNALETDIEKIIEPEHDSENQINHLKLKAENIDHEMQSKSGIEEIIKQAENCIKEYPNDQFGYYLMGSAYSLLKNYRLATEYFTNAIKLDNKFPGNYVKLGDILFENRDYDIAIDLYSKAIKLDKNNSKIYLKRGNVYKCIGEDLLASNDYSKVIQINKNNSELLYNNVPFIEDSISVNTTIDRLSPILEDEIITNDSIKSKQKDNLLTELYSKSKKLNSNELKAIINIINIFNKSKEEDK
ncbi:helix-turn-helix domain-containing protein [Clostridioides difficile]